MEDQRSETCDQLDEKTIALLCPFYFFLLSSLIKFNGSLGKNSKGKTWWGESKKKGKTKEMKQDYQREMRREHKISKESEKREGEQRQIKGEKMLC